MVPSSKPARPHLARTRPARPGLGLLATALAALTLPACQGPRSSLVEPRSSSGSEPTSRALVGARAHEPAPEASLDGRPLDLQRLVQLALTHSPALAAAHSSAEALAAGAEAAGALPEPRVSWAEFLDPIETRVGPQERRFEVTQALPWAGSREAQRGGARAGARAAAARAADLELALVADVEGAAWRRLLALGLADLEARGVELLASIEADVDSRYRTGKAEFADLLRASDEVVLAEERVAAAQDRARKESARLWSLVGVTPVQREAGGGPRDPGPDVRLDFAGPGLLPALASRSTRLATPALAALDAEVEVARQAERQAGYGRRSDLGLGFFLIDTAPLEGASPAGNGQDATGVMLSFTLPIRGDSYDAAEESARHRLQAGRSRRLAAEEDLARDIELLLEDLAAAERRIELFAERLAPRAAEATDAVRSAYGAGRATFAELASAARHQIRLEAQLLEARCERELARISLERHLGPTTER